MSNAWINGNFNICYLTEVIRQKDQLFVDILNSIRNQTIDGVKTFTSFPVTPSNNPTSNYQVANKKYVDAEKN
jgi:hypothetical protein